MSDLTHASFFSGAGGLDIGLGRAGWRTVSFSEVDPYACAVLAHRWPDVPNLGDIVRLAERRGHGDGDERAGSPDDERERQLGRAVLWSGGFPCQDLSVAGKRAGLGIDYSLNPNDADRLGLHGPDIERQVRTRSGLAFAYLDLVERHRPPWVLLENVSGLLSSHSGKDFGTLLRRLGEFGYGWAYRVLDARWFGVPQRRRRVFVLAHHVDGHPDSHGPAEVLAVGTRCGRHPAAGREEGEAASGGVGVGPLWSSEYVGPIDGAGAGPTPDPGGVREAPGMAGWAHDRPVAATPNSEHPVYVKGKRAQSAEDDESWREGDVSPTLNAFDVGDTRATVLVPAVEADDDLLPLGLDSHRYRVIGNGVAAPVAEWIGRRLAAYLASELERAV